MKEASFIQRNWSRLLSFVLFCLYIYIVCKVCFMSQVEIVSKAGKWLELFKKINGHDKIVHFFLFFPYPALAYLCLRPYNTSFIDKMIFLFVVMLLGASMAFNTECAQGIYFPSRSYDIGDFYADMLGMGTCCIFVLAAIVSHHIKHKHKK